MSRVGKMPIEIPGGVNVSVSASQVTVKGALGSMTQALSETVAVTSADNRLLVVPTNDSAEADALSGTIRALIANMVQGVSKGFEKRLTLVGVGFRAQVQGSRLNLQIGFSHPVTRDMPEGIKVEAPTPTELVLKGYDRQSVGQVAANIRAIRPPEPYKGKGIRYSDEKVSLKETKKK